MKYGKNDFTPFFYSSPIESLLKVFNEKYPIKLKLNERLISRVSARYPLIKKSEVVLIVSHAIQCMRNSLIKGDTLNLVQIFPNFKILIYKKKYLGKMYPALKIKISAIGRIKNGTF